MGPSSFAMAARPPSWRRHTVFDPMNAHSQADDPTLMHVMQFNSDEQMARIRCLPEAEQSHLMQIIETVLGQRDR